MPWSLGPQLQSEKYTSKYLIRAYSSSLTDKDVLRGGNTVYNFLSKSERLVLFLLVWFCFFFFFPGRIKTYSIRKVQCVSGKQNSSEIQIKNKTRKEGGNSQQCILAASCKVLLLCVWLLMWVLHLLCYCLSKTNQQEGRLERRKKGKEERRGGEILCICEAKGYCLSGFVHCYLHFLWYLKRMVMHFWVKMQGLTISEKIHCSELAQAMAPEAFLDQWATFNPQLPYALWGTYQGIFQSRAQSNCANALCWNFSWQIEKKTKPKPKQTNKKPTWKIAA